MGHEILTNGREHLTQFLPVASVAWVAERAEPLVAVGLSNRRARSNNLPAFAASVPRSAHLIQPAERRGKLISLG